MPTSRTQTDSHWDKSMHRGSTVPASNLDWIGALLDTELSDSRDQTRGVCVGTREREGAQTAVQDDGKLGA